MHAPKGALLESDWGTSIDHAKKVIAGKKLAILVGSDLTQEEAQMFLQFASQNFKGSPVFHFGTPGITSSKDDAPADRILKRKSKTANLHGLEKLGIAGFEKLPADTQAVLVIRGGRATVPALKAGVPVIGLGVFMRPQAELFAAILPGITFAEKDGTVVNYEGREQKLKRAIVPPRECKPLSEILMMWMNRKATSTGAA